MIFDRDSVKSVNEFNEYRYLTILNILIHERIMSSLLFQQCYVSTSPIPRLLNLFLGNFSDAVWSGNWFLNIIFSFFIESI